MIAVLVILKRPWGASGWAWVLAIESSSLIEPQPHADVHSVSLSPLSLLLPFHSPGLQNNVLIASLLGHLRHFNSTCLKAGIIFCLQQFSFWPLSTCQWQSGPGSLKRCSLLQVLPLHWHKPGRGCLPCLTLGLATWFTETLKPQVIWDLISPLHTAATHFLKPESFTSATPPALLPAHLFYPSSNLGWLWTPQDDWNSPWPASHLKISYSVSSQPLRSLNSSVLIAWF